MTQNTSLLSSPQSPISTRYVKLSRSLVRRSWSLSSFPILDMVRQGHERHQKLNFRIPPFFRFVWSHWLGGYIVHKTVLAPVTAMELFTVSQWTEPGRQWRCIYGGGNGQCSSRLASSAQRCKKRTRWGNYQRLGSYMVVCNHYRTQALRLTFHTDSVRAYNDGSFQEPKVANILAWWSRKALVRRGYWRDRNAG